MKWWTNFLYDEMNHPSREGERLYRFTLEEGDRFDRECPGPGLYVQDGMELNHGPFKTKEEADERERQIIERTFFKEADRRSRWKHRRSRLGYLRKIWCSGEYSGSHFRGPSFEPSLNSTFGKPTFMLGLETSDLDCFRVWYGPNSVEVSNMLLDWRLGWLPLHVQIRANLFNFGFSNGGAMDLGWIFQAPFVRVIAFGCNGYVWES